ncbi:LLM class flavin-dependent oxidoreductase [Paenibacillus ehimensis]|uniref:LLM class flavin-dependent oxidoreductase n=1 Tax=Paenibacillus ehimensis TaxID=79264 RepID=UPI003D2CBFAC
MIRLSILDQSPVLEGRTAAEALADTVLLAQEADKLGYSRFWVSEHHAMTAMASSSPEVLVSHLAAVTTRIRVGSGGVMLPHYSPFKVAENFRVLEAIYPNRIDLGIGRASGGMPQAAQALQEGKAKVAPYSEQVTDLIHYLHDSIPTNHRFHGIHVSPRVPTSPEMWLLGSSNESADLAAKLGIAYVYAHFLTQQADAEIISRYKRHYRPSICSAAPQTMIAMFAICGETDEEAEKLASVLDLTFLLSEHNPDISRVPTLETAESYPYTVQDISRIRNNRHRMIVGSPARVKQQILDYRETFETDEFMILTITHNFESRLKSYRLLSKVFQLANEK